MAQDDIQGQVVDGSGNPVSGAIVELTRSYQSSPQDEQVVRRVTTDSNGNYIFEEHPDGDGTTQEWHVSAYSHDGTAYVNSFNNPGVTADLPEFAIPDSGVSRWEFEQNANDSWNGNDGTEQSDVQYSTTAQVGSYSLDLDTTTDYVDTPVTSIQTPFSITLWVNLRSTSGVNSAKGCMWSMYSGGNNDVYLWPSSDFTFVDDTSTGVSSGVNPSTNMWYHVACVRGDADARIYVDGNREGSASASANTFDANSFQFGRFGDGSRNMDGLLDDARYYDKALSDTEVSNLYNTGSISG